MLADASFRQPRSSAAFFQHIPLWRFASRLSKQQLLARIRFSQMPDMRTGEAASTHESIRWGTRPTGFNLNCPHAEAQRQQPADHCCLTHSEPVAILLLNLQT